MSELQSKLEAQECDDFFCENGVVMLGSRRVVDKDGKVSTKYETMECPTCNRNKGIKPQP
jgi:hypothetical protein